MKYIANRMIKYLLQMVNIRGNIFKQQFSMLITLKITCEFSTLRMFTTIKQLFCNLINNAYHTRRRCISLLTNIQTTSLQLINHNKQSQQPINKDYIFVKHLNNINHLANNLNKIHTDNLQTANKMLINHLQEIIFSATS